MYTLVPTESIATVLADLRERLRSAQQQQDRFHEGLTLLELGTLARSCSDVLAAEEHYLGALVCFDGMHNAKYHSETLHFLGELEQERGNTDAAVTHFRAILTDLETDSDLLARGKALLAIGTLLFQHGQAAAARKWIDEALPVFQRHQCAAGEIRARLALAEVHESQANLDAAENEARTAMLDALRYQEHGLGCQARATLGRLIGLRSPGMGIEILCEALELAQRERLADVERTCRVALAEAYRREGNLESAYRCLVDAYASEKSYVRAERARYQAYLSVVRTREPRADQVTRAASVTELRTLLRQAPNKDQSLGIACIELDAPERLRARLSPTQCEALPDRIERLMLLSLRSGDILAHNGPDAFVLALPGATQRQARRIAERLRQTVTGADWSDLNLEEPVTVTTGICVGANSRQADAILDSATRSLREARAAGPNQISVGRTAA